jgi:hypothetical protein
MFATDCEQSVLAGIEWNFCTDAGTWMPRFEFAVQVGPPPPPPPVYERPGWARSSDVGDAIEDSGVKWKGRHRSVDIAICVGLRRYGVLAGEFGAQQFHRFKCILDAADGRFYTAWILVTRSG